QDSTAIAYNPQVSKYLYALYSGFLAAGVPPTQNQLYIFDPTSGYNLVKTLSLNNNADATVAETARDIALDQNGNLFFSGDASKIAYIPDVVSNPSALTNDSLVPWYQSETFQSPGTFTGLDIGLKAAGVLGDYNGNGVVDAADYTVWRDHLGQVF